MPEAGSNPWYNEKERWKRTMKRRILIGWLVIAAMALSGCGAIVVEDSEPVRIGMAHVEFFTECA